MSKILTLGKMFKNRIESMPTQNAIGWVENNQIHTYSTDELFKLIEALHHGLYKYNIKPFSRVSIISHTCKEWHFFDLAILCSRAVVIPIYPNYLAHEIEYIFNHSESSAIVVEKPIAKANA